MEKCDKKSSIHLAFNLFATFFKIGFYTFGGGWALVAQIQKEFVANRCLITDEDLLDITSVGRSMPGLMLANISYLFGFHVGGFPCALACVLGICLPPLITLTVISWCYSKFCNNLYVIRAMTGVRAAVVPIIASAANKLRKAALADQSGWFLLLIAFSLYFFFGVSCVYIVIACGILGLLICIIREKGGRKNGTA